jgi:uncharacterized protein YggE
MLPRTILLLAVGVLTTAALACGDGDDSSTPTPVIGTNSGLLAAAAVKAGERAQDQLSPEGDETGGSAAPGERGSAGDGVYSASYTASNDGINVTGYGMAVAQADSAIVELYFSTTTTAYPRSDSGSGSSDGSTPESVQTTTGISEEDLQPVIDALVAAGVDRADIEYLGGSYYDPYYASATLRITVRELDAVGGVIDAGTSGASGLTDVYLQSSYVSYTLADCAALEESALDAAIADADARSTTLASALGVTRGSIQGASSDAYWPYGGTACGGGYLGPYAVGGIAYAEGQSQQVTMYSTVSVTYAIQ